MCILLKSVTAFFHHSRESEGIYVIFIKRLYHLRAIISHEICAHAIFMDVQEKKQILQRYYFEKKTPAAFADPQKLFTVLNNMYPEMFHVMFKSSKLLNDQDAYSLQKTRPMYTYQCTSDSIGEQLDIDLSSMAHLALENDGVRFLLCVIDIPWIRPFRNKTAKVV